ncbi:MAG: C_GCAxxG_C_C family protein [Clostridia bacterium]|nr:C_GCAxxG_C_C family protein [Clostridia bacterium]
MEHSEKAAGLFLSGYNCAQSVAVAFCDVTGQDEKLAARLASPFGGGMGRMREVCGAVSGMLMVLGALYGYDDPTEKDGKKQLYTDVQALADKFRFHSLIIFNPLASTPGIEIPTPAPT